MENKQEYSYCDIITHAGNHKFLAKVVTSMQSNGKPTFGPSEVLVEGVWRPIKEFAVHWPNYSCNEYRRTEQVELPKPPPMYSRPTYCTVLTLHAGRFIAKAGEFTDSDGTFFGPISMLVNGKWMERADFEKKFGLLRSEDYRHEEEMPEPEWNKKRDVTDIEIKKPMDATIMTTKTEQAPYGTPKPASTEFDAKAFGTLVYLYRTSLLLPKTKAAEQIGINESALAAIENGTYHGIDEIAKAAKWTDLSAQAMGFYFGLKEAKEPEKKRWLPLAIIAFLFLLVTYILVWNL